MHRNITGKDSGLPAVLCAMQRFNASVHLYLQTKVVLRIAEVTFSQLYIKLIHNLHNKNTN